jgi:hypothetical protein
MSLLNEITKLSILLGLIPEIFFHKCIQLCMCIICPFGLPPYMDFV